jgi:hypothetical protein
MQFARIVLKSQATWADVCSTGVDMEDAAQWEEVDFTKFLADEPHKHWWKSVEGDCGIAYIQDPLREIRCYHLTGTDLQTHAAVIRGAMPTYDRGEVDALMVRARTPAERVVAIYLAAASAPPNRDLAIFDFLTRCLKDPDSVVRRGAVDAALIALWPNLREPLEQFAATDSDPELREFARETLETLQARAWSAAPGAFNFEPLPPDRRRITPLTGVGDDWYEKAMGRRPKRGPATAPSVTEEKPQGGKQVKLVFNYHECHAPDVPPGGWAGVAAFVRQLKDCEWEQQGQADDFSSSCDAEVRSIDDLINRARAFFVAEQHEPEEVVQIPFDKLAALMAHGGWSFVGGDFMEFEGNHNDTEITVVLEKTSAS